VKATYIGATAWSEADVPDQAGRTAVVTGANAGIGLETARVLAGRRAHVVLACRDPRKGKDAAAAIGSGFPHADLNVVHLDLASLASVREAAVELCALDRIDLLINNGGVMEPPYEQTEDGFELTFATNHLGHFALTGLLLDRMLEIPGSRIVTVSSEGHTSGVIDFDDLQSARGYRPEQAYFQSKLANLMFTYELQRRLAAAGAPTIAVAAHPGNARTGFGREMPLPVRVAMRPELWMLTSWLMQSPERGALAAVRAAVDPGVRGGEYYGPPGRAQFTGYPERVESNDRSHDTAAQRRLWRESERLTGVTYRIGAHGQQDSVVL
jgi:NAD(P)-dependent dehydrogenase (short-subunit alcohol dehydrogenase family)